jgi:hypothetical protein
MDELGVVSLNPGPLLDDCLYKNGQAISKKKDFGTESRHIRVVNRRHTEGCRGFSRRINAKSGIKILF